MMVHYNYTNHLHNSCEIGYVLTGEVQISSATIWLAMNDVEGTQRDPVWDSRHLHGCHTLQSLFHALSYHY